MKRWRAILVACLACAAAGGFAHAREEPFDPFGAAKVDGRTGAAIPLDDAFRDETGRQVTLRGLAGGKPLVIAPVQHHCPNICGLTLEGLKNAIAGQGYRPGPDFSVVALGIDPREGPDAASLSERRLSPSAGKAEGVHAVVGSAGAVAAVTQALGYHYGWDPRIGQFAHIAAVAVVTPDGHLSHWLYGVAPRAQDLHLALTDAGQGRLGAIGDQIQLLCYHYDPRTGHYDGLVWTVLRATGGATAAGLALLVAFSLRREARRKSPE